jgi:ABC-type sulfate/molybdate transport systems ATPase subunit
MTGRTTFVVANRLSLLRRADTILVLSKGSLVQNGSHDELIGVPGPYRDAAVLQLMDSNQALGATPADGSTAPARDGAPVPTRLQSI